MTARQFGGISDGLVSRPSTLTRTFRGHHLAAILAAYAVLGVPAHAQDITRTLQNVISRQETGGSDGQPKKVTFQTFSIGRPRQFTTNLNGQWYPDGPGARPGTVVYPVVTTYTVQSTYRDSLQFTQKPDQRFSCFVSVQNYWACNKNGGTYNWKNWSVPNSAGTSQYSAPTVDRYTQTPAPRPNSSVGVLPPSRDPYESIKQALANGPGRAGTITDLRIAPPRVYYGNEVPGVYVPRGTSGYQVTFGLAANGPYSNGAIFYKEFLCFPGEPLWSCQFVRSIPR